MYLNKKQAAEKLNVSTRTIDRLVSEKRIKYYRLSPRCIRFDPADIDEYVKEKAE